MKLTLARDALLAALQHAARVVERRNTIPILANVLLRVAEGRATLKATDLDLEMSQTLPAQVEAPGALTVPAHTLLDIARKLPAGADVKLEERDGTLRLACGRARFTLQTLPEGDFPDLSAGDLSHTFTVRAGDLRRLIDRVSFAISTEETRYYLNGIYLHLAANDEGPTLRAVATDGHRLAQAEMLAPEGSAGMAGVILPRKLVGELAKILDDKAGEATVSLSPTKIRVAVGGLVLTSKLIDGTFPDYGRVIPAGNRQMAEMDKADLAAAVDRVATVASERGRAVRFSYAENRLLLSVTNTDTGQATEELEISWTGDALDIGFNSQYMAGILSILPGDTARLAMDGPGTASLITTPSDGSFLAVLMPMRV
ncbi:DNA polymerase III subunit beta [Aquabacter sp. L1I39]|uniref:DNA polymerase III subunit beta n=1 Tax=Aquabacter sp. L1I39 TaxID=2820278 RepID=UPI001ADAD213|nr:DNA polymerase III subunit beta [Aquabacter sp. L1I39]QTL01947.1 DNA polymerase III subunit beta [Aquabacter sp. L1I39]